jgi:hypothetical protein
MRYRRFLLWNATGGAVWATLMGTLGYLFGTQLPLIERVVGQFGVGVVIALLLAIGVRFTWGRRTAIATTLTTWWAQARTQPISFPSGAAALIGAVRLLFSRRYRWLLAAISLGVATLGGAGILALLTDAL